MIDLIELAIQFDGSIIECVDDNHALVGVDYQELDISLGAREIYWDIDGVERHSGKYHAYEKLPTSFTGIALKANLDGYFFPHVLIKCSPAKIMQGHNVFGSDDLELCITEMVYWLKKNKPKLTSLLALNTAEVRKMDVTYSTSVSCTKVVRSAIDFMSRISNGQTKPTRSQKYESTVYWGGKSSRLIRQKCYAKFDEYMLQLNDYKKLADKGDSNALAIVNVMSDERLINVARKSMRWECTFMKRWLQRRDIPVNAWELINYQKDNPDFLHDIWHKGFEKIFDAMKGLDMKIVNDDKVLASLKNTWVKQLKSGKCSFRKAINLYSFYCQLKSIGYYEIKKQGLYSPRRFNELVNDLVISGYSKAYLQNLHVDSNSKTVNFVKLIEIDFTKQNPDWYVEPVATPLRLLA